MYIFLKLFVIIINSTTKYTFPSASYQQYRASLRTDPHVPSLLQTAE